VVASGARPKRHSDCWRENELSKRHILRSARTVSFVLYQVLSFTFILTATLASPTDSYALNADSAPSSDIKKLLVPILIGVVIVVCIWVFRKWIQRFFRLLFTFILNVLFSLFVFFTILGVGYLINNYSVIKGSGPVQHVLHYAASALFVLSFLSAVVILIRAVWKFAQGLFGRGAGS
jgi:hypothetical protein